MKCNSSTCPLVVHLIPYDGIGGVESAARSLPSAIYPGLRFQKAFLARRGQSSLFDSGDYVGSSLSENDLLNLAQALCWLNRRQPRVLVASLWRCYLVAVLVKVLRPSCRLVCFLHCPKSVHLADKIFAWLAMVLSAEIWADSAVTLENRVPVGMRKKALAMPLVLDSFQPVNSQSPSPSFVFWGRIAPEKNLRSALDIFREVLKIFPSASFQIIGPDGGSEASLRKRCRDLDFEDAVSFCGPMCKQEICELAALNSFYLQTSILEGMAISVIEAMQLGLVPVVTPVGEIVNYCRDGHNALLVSDSRETARRIAESIGCPGQYHRLRNNAINTWAGTQLYRDRFLVRSRRLLGAGI